jgi:WhiB family transcriptional regulator, redox-sensing transcriptional regulator
MSAEEVWADIVGTGGAYRVSDTGEVHGVNRLARTCNLWGESTRRVPARLMSQRIHDGRATVQICIDGQPRNIVVHTAVLEAFVGPRPRGLHGRAHQRRSVRLQTSELALGASPWPAQVPAAPTLGRSMSTLEDIYADLAAIPPLRGARCKRRSDVWDEHDDPELVEFALNQCRSCVAQTDCERWFLGLRPGQRPHGVIAGRVNRPPRPRKRAS